MLWVLGEGNVKDVRGTIAANRNLAYTTVMTVLDRLARKGGVSRRKVGRSFVYAPVLRRENLRRLAIRDLVDRFFDGSENALMDYLRNGNARVTLAAESKEAVHLDAALL